MSIVNVNNTTKKIKIANGLYELRGNFVQETNGDGEVSYKCDAYRTKSDKVTFEELYSAERISELKEYLSSTDWIYAKCAEEGLNASEVYPDIVAKRKNARAGINKLSN